MNQEQLRDVVGEELYSSVWNEEHQRVDYLVDALWPVLAQVWDECFQALSDYVEHQETRGTNPGPFPQNPYAKQGQEA